MAPVLSESRPAVNTPVTWQPPGAGAILCDMRRLALLLAAVVLTVACHGVRSAGDEDWTPEPATKDKRLREDAALNAAQLEPLDDRQLALVGVRHDLMLSGTPHEPRCSCLAVEVGSGNEGSKFFWTGTPPDTGADALAVAIGARGVPCPGGDPDDRRRRPSISAVDRDGDDILIEVEDLPEGRPLASGAVVPKPGPKGSIYIRPHRGNALYGHGVGTAHCKVR